MTPPMLVFSVVLLSSDFGFSPYLLDVSAAREEYMRYTLSDCKKYIATVSWARNVQGNDSRVTLGVVQFSGENRKKIQYACSNLTDLFAKLRDRVNEEESQKMEGGIGFPVYPSQNCLVGKFLLWLVQAATEAGISVGKGLEIHGSRWEVLTQPHGVESAMFLVAWKTSENGWVYTPGKSSTHTLVPFTWCSDAREERVTSRLLTFCSNKDDSHSFTYLTVGTRGIVALKEGGSEQSLNVEWLDSRDGPKGRNISELQTHSFAIRGGAPASDEARYVADSLASGRWKARFRQDPILWLYAAEYSKRPSNP